MRDIIPDTTISPPGLPKALVIEFASYTGPSFHPTKPGYIALAPRMVVYEWNGKEIQRLGFPLRLAKAITIHKS